MVDEVTRETRIKDLGASVRLVNSLASGYPLFFFGKRDATVGDYVDLPDKTIMRVSNFGRKSLRDWKRLTAHLREEYTLEDREQSVEQHEEYHALKKLRATLNTIGGVHKNLARLYGELAEIVLPAERT
jgi:DNA-directed RNA polymerase alpha subunit